MRYRDGLNGADLARSDPEAEGFHGQRRQSAGPPATPNERRRVGRPSTLESGGASFATVLELIRAGAATTRLGIERQRNSVAP